MRPRSHLRLLALLLLNVGCGEPAAGTGLLRLSGIPDADKARLEQQFGPVAEYLEAELGIPVRYEHMTDYTGAVIALGSGRIDLAWLGGVTAIDADRATGGEVTFVACRDTDLRFKSYFIANADAIARGAVKPVTSLRDLAPMLKDLRFTFGSKKSTSGHIMPRSFMVRAGIDPEADLLGRPGYQEAGGHDATLRTVASGQFDLGALNYTAWERADDEMKKRAPIIWVTPDYVDYCLVADNRLGEEMIDKIRDAFVNLDASNPEHREILAAFSAERFVPARRSDWDAIAGVLADPRLQDILK